MLAKRRVDGRGKQASESHIWLASIGTGLVLAHGASGLLKPPATLFILLLLLIGLGVWSRLQGARMMARTFGEKRAGFAKPDPAVRARLGSPSLKQKQALLAKLDPSANEALFSPQFRHWLSAPASGAPLYEACRRRKPHCRCRRRPAANPGALAAAASIGGAGIRWRAAGAHHHRYAVRGIRLQTAAISIGFTLQLGIFERHVTPSPDDRSGTLHRL